jgi:hypothetical protein
MKRDSAHTRAGQRQIGALSPRYSFALNPYSDARFTACPECRSITRLRKLPLAIHVDDFGMIILRKTCRLCTACEMVIAHQDELEPLVAAQLRGLGHSIDQPDYLVLGTVDPTVWRRGLTESVSLDEVVQHMADFRKHLQIEQTGHGWEPSR